MKLAELLEEKQNNAIELYSPHKKQNLFHELGVKAKERLFLAGNRTGKTYSGAMEGAMHLTGLYPSWWKGKRFSHPVEMWATDRDWETPNSWNKFCFL